MFVLVVCWGFLLYGLGVEVLFLFVLYWVRYILLFFSMDFDLEVFSYNFIDGSFGVLFV